MKNRSLLMLIVTAMFFATTMVSAQSDASNRVSLGLKFGANLSNVYDTQGEEFEADAKLGMATGLFITLPITHFLGVQPEILFSQKGYRGSGSVLGSDYSFKRTTNYIDVPLLLTFRTGDYLTLLFGPQYSFLLSQNYTFKSDVLDISRDEQFDNENLRKNTFCVTGGVDINLSNIVIGARAGWDVQSNEGDGTSSTPRYKNMWYQATIGYRF
ncbi:MAG: porin family protein [Paludibacter sp.]|nr:porin family protein [Paludibacter sp.]